MSTVGVVHLTFALVAMAAGGVVVALPKGTRGHRTVGHLYASSMVGVVATSFGMYGLTGTFGVFHAAAVLAAGTLALGMANVLLRRPRGRWMEAHARTMSWSYVGLLCAFAAESLSRFAMPALAPRLSPGLGWPLFWSSVGVATAAVAIAGAWVIRRQMPLSLARTPAAMRRELAVLKDAQVWPEQGRTSHTSDR